MSASCARSAKPGFARQVNAAQKAIRLNARHAQQFAAVSADQRGGGDRRLQAQQLEELESSPLNVV